MKKNKLIKEKKVTVLIFTMILNLFLYNACEKENTQPSQPVYINGEGVIGNNGGTVKINDENSPLNGAFVFIPQGALTNEVNVSITEAPEDVNYTSDTSATVFKFEPEGITFNKPVEIGLPYDSNMDTSLITAWNIDTENQAIIQLPGKVDPLNKVYKTTTSHFSYYTLHDDGVRVNTNLKYFSADKDLVFNMYVDGWALGNNYGFSGIPTKVWSWPFGITSAREAVDEGDPLYGGYIISYFNVEIKKKNNFWFDQKIAEQSILVKRIGSEADGYGAEVYKSNLLSNNIKYRVESLNDNKRESFFSGRAIVFTFKNLELENDEKYYIKTNWGLVGSADASIIGGRYTDLYSLNTFEFAKSPSEMDDTGFRDNDNNLVDDDAEVEGANKPTADFSSNKMNAVVGEIINFSDESTNNPTTWEWDFGDGSSSNEKNPSYSYTSAGIYTVQLTVTNEFGSDTETKTGYITINESSNQPVANFDADKTTINEGESVQFNDQSSNNPTSWNWDFGDGSTSTEQNPSHVYSASGSYTVELTVTNSYGSDTETKTEYIVVNGSSETLYYEDFTSDPGFTSLSENHAFWDDSQGNYYVKTFDNEQNKYWAYSPQFTTVSSSNNVVIELDMLCENADWGTYPGVHFYNNEPLEINESSRSLAIRFVWSDNNSKKMSITSVDQSGNISYISSNSFSNNTWYNVLIEYSGSTSKANIKITDKSSGDIFFEKNNVDFNLKDISYLGVGYYNGADYGDEWSPVRIDNISISSQY